MISKKRWKKNTVFHTEQKTDFLKRLTAFLSIFKDIVLSEQNLFRPWLKENIHQTHRQFWFVYQLTGLYMIRGFTERYFPEDYSFILENHFYFVIAPDYCFKASLSRIFCVNSSVKVLSPLYKDPSTHLFRISSLCL